jgi:glycerophosphoryl diester phosphodiesterase
VVVGHDSDFMRVSGNKLEMWQATNADLTTLDVGTFFDPKFSGERVPTLREVLDLTRSRAGILIELKYYGHDQSLEAKVVDLVEQAKMEPNIAIMSLDYSGIRKAQALRPSWNYGLLNAVAVGDLTNLDVNFLGLTARGASFSMIRRAHQRGMKVYAWTIDDPVQMSVMMSRGVDGIITDQVALARKVKEMRAKITVFGRIVIWIAGETGLLRGVERSSDLDEM